MKFSGQKIVITSLGISVLAGFLSYSALADLAVINLRIKAIIASNTCVVNQNSANQTVNLGVWASRQFFAGPTAATDLVPFSILLEDCGDKASKVKVTFNGVSDNKNNALFSLNASSTASNIAINILDINKNTISPGSDSIYYPLNSNLGSIPLQFYARYMATDRPVNPGSANGEAIFSLTYD